ncbi:App1 family protein [Winogradskyella tangerina]|uniref:App1 family protein n=1 Tax=Winogradskyella tangerina TaxID=2023240 RepID=UPI000DBE2215|nr:phosphatase domain-containing protein [Winogradskyella tangerina]
MFKKDPLQIIPFDSYGTFSKLFLKGRALEDESIDLNKKSGVQLFINSWKRFETDEVRNTPLTIKLPNNERIEFQTDTEGYYIAEHDIDNLEGFVSDEGWLDYEVSFATSHKTKIQNGNKFHGRMLIPNVNSAYGVVSDIDDTILFTGVTSKLKWRVIINTLFKTPHKRKALEGAADFYELLHKGKSGMDQNPIFYVSNSPWNLYRYLDMFLTVNKFPAGPILLRDIRMPYDKTPRPELAHKYNEIYNILNTYPSLNFILIGDCGEKDAHIYRDVVEKFPNRILAIYLRAVKHTRRMSRIVKLFEDYNEVPVLIVNSGEEALEHARSFQFIK